MPPIEAHVSGEVGVAVDGNSIRIEALGMVTPLTKGRAAH
jgi:hypothetical protein